MLGKIGRKSFSGLIYCFLLTIAKAYQRLEVASWQRLGNWLPKVTPNAELTNRNSLIDEVSEKQCPEQKDEFINVTSPLEEHCAPTHEGSMPRRNATA
jgi:hypothetical protein